MCFFKHLLYSRLLSVGHAPMRMVWWLPSKILNQSKDHKKHGCWGLLVRQKTHGRVIIEKSLNEWMYKWLPLLCGVKKTSLKNNWIILLIIKIITPIGPETISLHCRLHYSFSRATFILLSIDLLFLAPCPHLPAIMDLTSITVLFPEIRILLQIWITTFTETFLFHSRRQLKQQTCWGSILTLFYCSVTELCLNLWPRGLQYARLPCPSPSPGAYSNSCPLKQWCHQTISSSVVLFSSCLLSFPASGKWCVVIRESP